MFSLLEALLWSMNSLDWSCIVFISCYSSGTHSLQRNPLMSKCNLMLNFSSDEETVPSTSCIACG